MTIRTLMTTSLARYHARAPRYILDTEDNSLIRLSGASQLTWEEKTELRDVSLTGLSFVAPQDLSPQIGEVIKIQFSVPGSDQMACYAIVIRLEKINQFDNMVGVHFYKLDRVQRVNLVQGLTHKINQNNASSKQRKLTNAISIIGLVLTLGCWLFLMKVYFF
ncbi:PilZ domain-containing protein [Pseudobdellovibrio exovorus]|uniref:PilZ domain-containing protein n=1 Tax=Pseudobdellovibrio exovorus JSS TaxID=1184267 RepID=M4VAJ2_9BACT|nr:PilZ domain-containing protein [Pseudobdellovibrio exovorus]AGH95026.1 hypothetical protein A11Q_808 [Pseudobdellovibrio exovorus JSS]